MTWYGYGEEILGRKPLKAAMEQWKQSQRNDELKKKLAQAPVSFLNWMEERKASISDLMPLNSLTQINSINPLLEEFEKQKLTRSQGKQILDLLVDLVMMKTSSQQLIPSGKNWLDQLKGLRYPNTSKKDQQPGLESKDWPQFIRVQKQRAGDRTRYQMTLQFYNEEELLEKLQRLNRKMEDK